MPAMAKNIVSCARLKVLLLLTENWTEFHRWSLFQSTSGNYGHQQERFQTVRRKDFTDVVKFQTVRRKDFTGVVRFQTVRRKDFTGVVRTQWTRRHWQSRSAPFYCSWRWPSLCRRALSPSLGTWSPCCSRRRCWRRSWCRWRSQGSRSAWTRCSGSDVPESCPARTAARTCTESFEGNHNK